MEAVASAYELEKFSGPVFGRSCGRGSENHGNFTLVISHCRGKRCQPLVAGDLFVA